MQEERKKEVTLYTMEEMLSPEVTGEMIAKNKVDYYIQEYEKILKGYRNLLYSATETTKHCEKTLKLTKEIDIALEKLLVTE